MGPNIAITMGDPAGIGPEVIAKAAAEFGEFPGFNPLVVGNHRVMQETIERLGLELKLVPISQPDFAFTPGRLPVLEVSGNEYKAFDMGSTHPWCGEVSYQSVVRAVELCVSGVAEAVVTAPISKAAWHRAGHFFDGHTGLLAKLTECDNYRMTFASEKLNVMLTTTHIPLCRVCETLTTERVYETIRLGDCFLKRLGRAIPRIAVCGVNPHAGESGIFGSEDEKMVKEAVNRAEADGISVSGPLPSDTIFLRTIQGEFDLVIAQYHDQGLIPVKLIAFDTAVNISVGLPIIRTSVDHGTAFDIAGQGVADHRNMQCAIEYAVKLSTVSDK